MMYCEMTFRAFNHKKRRIRKKYLNRLLKAEKEEHKHIWISWLEVENYK